MCMKRLLKGGTVISGSESRKLDVLMDEDTGTITQIGEDLPESLADEVMDVGGRYLFPGFIDAHTHFNLEVSGTVTADDYRTGTRAAISGGTTMIIDFATQNKGETLAEALENWHRKADGKASCDYAFHMAISDWNEAVSEELEEIIQGGITSFKVYMTYDAMVLDDKQIYQVLRRLKEVGGITGVHCENKGLIDALIEEKKREGALSPAVHPLTRPDLAEAEAVGRLLKIAKAVDTPVIIVHLSTKAGYREVEYARAEGQEVYLETCPQYLVMDDRLYSEPEFGGAKYVCSPPLRKAADQQQLWEALAANQIQTIGTDHCSFTLAQKAAGKDDFSKIPNGMPGTEHRPSLIYSYGVKTGRLTKEQMCRLLSENPAKLYGVYPQKGCLAPGSDADIVVWNPDYHWIISSENQVANTDYCPFEGMQADGRAEQVFLHGKLVTEQGRVVQEGLGSYIKRKRYMNCL